jgi:hypothetical protein
MSGASRGIVFHDANHRLILRSDAQHRVSKDGPEGFARLAHTGALPGQARDRPFEAPSGRLRARGSGHVRAREESQ